MNTIPEGKELIWAEGVYKEPIDGIPFSNAGLTLGVSKYIDKGERGEVLQEVIQKMVEEYFRKYSEALKSTNNEIINNLRQEVYKEKDSKIEKAKQEILRLRKILKEHNINYKEN